MCCPMAAADPIEWVFLAFDGSIGAILCILPSHQDT